MNDNYCEVCSSKIKDKGKVCKRCDRILCSTECKKLDKKKQLALYYKDNKEYKKIGPHLMCKICQQESEAQDMIRRRYMKKFDMDSDIAKEWLNSLGIKKNSSTLELQFKQLLAANEDFMKSEVYQKIYDCLKIDNIVWWFKENFSFREMLVNSLSEEDRKNSLTAVWEVTIAFFSQFYKETGFYEEIIDLIIFLLLFCHRATALEILIQTYIKCTQKIFNFNMKNPQLAIEHFQKIFTINCNKECTKKFIQQQGVRYLSCFLVGKLNFEYSFLFFDSVIQSQDVQKSVMIGFKKFIIIYQDYIEQYKLNASLLNKFLIRQLKKQILFSNDSFDLYFYENYTPKEQYVKLEESYKISQVDSEEVLKQQETKLFKASQRILLLSIECERLIKNNLIKTQLQSQLQSQIQSLNQSQAQDQLSKSTVVKQTTIKSSVVLEGSCPNCEASLVELQKQRILVLEQKAEIQGLKKINVDMQNQFIMIKKQFRDAEIDIQKKNDESLQNEQEEARKKIKVYLKQWDELIKTLQKNAKSESTSDIMLQVNIKVKDLESIYLNQCKDLEQKLRQSQANEQQLKSELKSKQDEIDLQLNKFQDGQKKLQQLQDLQNENIRLKDMNKRANAKLFLVIIECQRLQEQLSKVAESMKFYDNEYKRNQQEINDLNLKLQSKIMELSQTEQKLAIQKQDITIKQEQQPSNNTENLLNQIENLQKENKKLYEENGQLSANLNKLKNTIDSQNAQIQQLVQANEMFDKQYTVVISDIRIELQNWLDTEKKNHEEQLKQKNKKVQQLELKIMQITEEAKQRDEANKKLIEELREQIEELKSQQERNTINYVSQINDLNEKLKKALSEIDQLNIELKSQNVELQNLKIEKQDIINQFEQYKIQKQKELDTLQSKLNALRELQEKILSIKDIVN